MVSYYEFDAVIWQVIKRGKDRSKVSHLGVALREFDTEKLSDKEKSDIRGLYPEIKTKVWLLYVGNALNNNDNKLDSMWKNRLAYVPFEMSGEYQDELRGYIKRQIRDRVKEKFKGNSDLEKFAESL